MKHKLNFNSEANSSFPKWTTLQSKTRRPSSLQSFLTDTRFLLCNSQQLIWSEIAPSMMFLTEVSPGGQYLTLLLFVLYLFLFRNITSHHHLYTHVKKKILPLPSTQLWQIRNNHYNSHVFRRLYRWFLEAVSSGLSVFSLSCLYLWYIFQQQFHLWTPYQSSSYYCLLPSSSPCRRSSLSFTSAQTFCSPCLSTYVYGRYAL